MKKRRWIWLVGFIAIIMAVVLIDTKNLKRPEKLKGGFHETVALRNKNNVGTVLRLYAVSVKEPEIADYNAYGDAMPHTPNGNTIVYFFDAKDAAPTKLTINAPHFDTVTYKTIMIYKKNGSETVKVEKGSY